MCEMIHQVTNTKTTDSHRHWLYKIGGVAALATGMLLLMGMISLILSVLQTSNTNGWLLLFQNNWLVKIFLLHAEISDFHADLQGLAILDIVILLMLSVICLTLSTIFTKAGRVWSFLAFALSLIAILLFVVTQVAGRSTVMLAVLINSFVVLRDKSFSKVTAYTGILASVFLFVGDLTVGNHSNVVTIFFGVGYILLTAWFFLIARILFRLDWVS
jgi:hypothetical protein